MKEWNHGWRQEGCLLLFKEVDLHTHSHTHIYIQFTVEYCGMGFVQTYIPLTNPNMELPQISPSHESELQMMNIGHERHISIHVFVASLDLVYVDRWDPQRALCLWLYVSRALNERPVIGYSLYFNNIGFMEKSSRAGRV